MLENDNVKNIKVHIAGREYPIYATEEEAKVLGAIEKEIGAEFDRLQQRYVNQLGKQDILSMLLITYVKQLHEVREVQNLDEIDQRLEQIERYLDQTLQR